MLADEYPWMVRPGACTAGWASSSSSLRAAVEKEAAGGFDHGESGNPRRRPVRRVAMLGPGVVQLGRGRRAQDAAPQAPDAANERRIEALEKRIDHRHPLPARRPRHQQLGAPNHRSRSQRQPDSGQAVAGSNPSGATAMDDQRARCPGSAIKQRQRQPARRADARVAMKATASGDGTPSDCHGPCPARDGHRPRCLARRLRRVRGGGLPGSLCGQGRLHGIWTEIGTRPEDRDRWRRVGRRPASRRVSDAPDRPLRAS